MPTETKLHKIAAKWEQMQKDRVEANPIDISNFIPSLDDMIKEDCVIDVLQNVAKDIKEHTGKDSPDDYKDVAYYSAEPYKTTPGYYPDARAFVLRVKDVEHGNKEWELNSTDGDTYNFKLSNLDSGGKFTIGDSTYDSFADYVKKMNISDNERNTITLRSIGIDSAEIPHYDIAVIKNKNDIVNMSLNEVESASANKNATFCYLPYNINKKGDNIDNWTVTDRDKNKKIPFYKVSDGGKTTYYEIRDDIDASKYVSKNDAGGYDVKAIVGSEKPWGSETVLDGYRAQQRVKEILGSNQVEDMILVLDNSSMTPTKLSSNYTPYTSLWYMPETIKHMIDSWQGASNIPLQRLAYSPFGTDKYGRFLGTLYVKLKTPEGTRWIDLSKYVLAGTKNTIPNPDFNGSPELQQIKDGVSQDAFPLSTYDKNGMKYLDDIDVNGEQSYKEMKELHKNLTGIDIDEKNECYMLLGDCLFLIPPQSIRNISNVEYSKVNILRGKGSMAKNQANREQMLEIDLFFYGENGINGIKYETTYPNGKTGTYYMNGLRALFAQFKVAPFLPIQNYYINHILNIEVVSMVNIMVSTVEGFPKLLKATLTLREFNYRVYMPDLPLNQINDEDGSLKEWEPVFAQCFEWQLFRYYYQRSIIHGESIKKYDYNTYDYGKYLYSYKNVLQRADLKSQSIEFYTPDEKWLSSALKVKKDKDRYGQFVKNVELSTNSKNFFKDAASLGNTINSLNLDELNKILKDTIIIHSGDKHTDIVGKNSSSWQPNIGFYSNGAPDSTRNKEIKNKLSNMFRSYANKISGKKIVRSVTIDEEANPNNHAINYIINAKLDFSNISSNEKSDILEKLRTLDGGSDSRNYLKNDILKTKIVCSFGPDGKFSKASLEKSNELNAILAAYDGSDNDSEDGRDKIEEETFNYANYQDPKAMAFVPYIKDNNGNSIPINVDELAVSTSNTFTQMYLKAQDGFAPQFMGGSDVTIEFKITTRDELVIALLNQLPSYVIQLTKTYRRVLPCCPLKVKNDYLQMFGINEVLIDSIDINTVDGFPGLYDIRVRMTSVDRTMRQQEALRKINTDGFSSNISKAQIKDYFALETSLAQAELYPDLDLPTLDELSSKGWEYLKYKNENRVFVDPDFYIVYSFKYTALLIKQIVKDYMYEKYYSEDTDDNNTTSSRAKEIYLQDDSGMKLSGMLNNVLGAKFENENDLANIYDDTLETITTQSEQDATKKIAYNNQSLDDVLRCGASLDCLTAYGIENGWQIKPGWYASIPQPYINDLIEKLDESGIERANVKDEDKNNEWVKELYNIRKKAIGLIENILEKPMDFSGNTDDYEINSLKYAVDKIFGSGDGLELLKLFDPMGNSFSGGNIKAGYDIVNDNASADDIKNGITAGLHNKANTFQTKDFYDTPNVLSYIEAYLFASACALSGANSFSKGMIKENWYPTQYKNFNEEVPNVRIKEKSTSSKSLSNANNMKDALEKGRFFGAYQLGIYTVNQITDIMSSEVKIDYGQTDIYEQSMKNHNRFCEEGFIDPYYNYEGYRSSIGKEYIENITKSSYDNSVAFLRVVLTHLKRMIIDGYFFSEIDIIAKDYDTVKAEWEKALEEEVRDEWYNAGDDDHGGEAKDKQKQYKSDKIAEQYGITPDELTELIEVAIPETYSKMFCARLVYPFIAAMSENHPDIMKLIKDRDYDKFNLMTLGSNVGSADYSPMDKFLKALYAIQVIGYEKTIDEYACTSNSQKIFNSIMQEIVKTYSDDPTKYVLHSFYDMLTNDKRGRLIRAFPTYYLVFVDEGRKIGTWKLFDNFYNMSSVSNIQVVKSRKVPVDTCTFTMTNLYTSYAAEYDNSTYQQYVDIYGVKDYFDSIFSPRSYLTKEDMIRQRKELTDTTILQAGTRVHVRMGYGSNAAKLPVVFNGKVAEVECGEVVDVVCQGDGHELMNPLNALGEYEAKSLEEAQSWITILKDIRGSLARGGESPKNLLAKLMTAKYGGLVKNIIRETFDERFFGDNPFGIYHFGDRRFKEIFKDSEIVQNIYEVSNDSILSGYTTLVPDKTETSASPTINCTIQDKTMWDIMNMCANAGDDYYAAVRDFGFRSTVCLCKANQYYAYAYFEDKGNYFERRKPFQQYHYYDSYNDIVYNTIKASEKNMKTNAVGTWEATDYIWGTSQSTVGPIYLDMNIYPEYQKSMTVDTGLIASGNGGLKLNFATACSERWKYDANDDKVNKSLAEKMTTNVLRNSVKDMYEGELCILGDPSVKPFDRMDIVDTYEDMSGSVEVETVIFSMNSDTGFTTTIVPDVIARAGDCSQEIATQTLTGNFVMSTGLIVTAKLGMKKLLETTGVNLAKKLLNTTGISAIKTLIADTALGSILGEGASIELLGITIANPVGLVATIVAATCTYVFARNVKEMFYRWMKNIQAITVYPIQKNQRPLIAGMAGHKGSVYGYSYTNPKDSIQGMVMGILEKGSKIPVAGFLVDALFTGDEYDAIYNYWKESLGINKVDNDVLSEAQGNLVRENLVQDLFNSASLEFSARAASIQSLKSKVRIDSFDTNSATDDTYLKYQIGGISDEVKNVKDDTDSDKYKIYAKLPSNEKKKVRVEDLGQNQKIQALIPVEDDPDIKLAKSGGHPVLKSFKFAHSESPLTFDCNFESGNREIRYIADGNVFDLPMLQQDALLVLKVIINDEALKDATVCLLSGTRVNDTRSWKNTGFAFALGCDDKKALLKAVKSAKKACYWYGSKDSDKNKKSVFAYQEYSDGVMITVYASKENI